MMIPTIVPIYAAIFAVMLVALSLRVARTRGDVRVAIGDGGNIVLQRRIRVQGNFTEYVPMALILFTVRRAAGLAALAGARALPRAAGRTPAARLRHRPGAGGHSPSRHRNGDHGGPSGRGRRAAADSAIR